MATVAELRKQVESALAERIPSALSMRSVVLRERVSCGVPEIDAALGGGFPLGGIAELTGTASSGRTTLVLATLAGVTQQGGACAYVDVSDAFDPLSAAALGIDLRCLLWVRAGDANAAVASSPLLPQAPAKLTRQEKALGGGRHPRTETLGMDRAMGQRFRGPHEASRSLDESLEFTPQCSESIRRKHTEPVIFMPQPQLSCARADCVPHKPRAQKPWSRLDQALRATDLLLNTGGFRAVVLDMGDIRPEHARRVPLATWYRFRPQVGKAQMLFLLLTRVACASSCAAVSLYCKETQANWQQTSERGLSLLTGLRYRIRITGNRVADPYCKKTTASAQAAWSSITSWSR